MAGGLRIRMLRHEAPWNSAVQEQLAVALGALGDVP